MLSRRSAGLIAGLLAGLLLGGCAQQPRFEELDGTLQRRVHLDVPFHPQTAYHCGPAALAEVLNYRGVAVTPAQLGPQVYVPERKGSLSVEVRALPRRYKHLSYPLAPSPDDLLAEVQAGNPVLVLQNLAFNWWPQWHYAVVVGYDLPKRELILHSGTRENYRVSLRTFMATWDRTERWAIVITAPETIPATAEPQPFLQAAHALESAGRKEAARRAYEAAALRWPEEATVRLTAGTAALAADEPRQARTHLEKAVALRPDDPAAWNNLAYALAREGCPEAAAAAIDRAVERAPGDKRFRDSRQEIIAWPQTQAGNVCAGIPAGLQRILQ